MNAPQSAPHPAFWIKNPAAVIERTFRVIAEQGMADFPLVNPALSVETVACQPYRFANGVSVWLTVLITPWSMNLMLLPAADGENDWPTTAPGGKYCWRFPSGIYEFTVAEVDGLGRYHLCSLFSPPTEFADRQSARQTACAVLAALLTEEEGKRQQGKQAREPASVCDNIPDHTQISVNKRRAFLGLESLKGLKVPEKGKR